MSLPTIRSLHRGVLFQQPARGYLDLCSGSAFCSFKKYLSTLGTKTPRIGFAWCTKQGHRDAFIHCKQEKGETLMKTALVRILTIATLATSISAFAAADEPKTNNAANASATQQQE